MLKCVEGVRNVSVVFPACIKNDVRRANDFYFLRKNFQVANAILLNQIRRGIFIGRIITLDEIGERDLCW